MAIKNYENTLREWENVIRVNLKVANPSLLKSGSLGILTNYLASIKFDAMQFYTRAFQETNVGLAQDFNSMLYHSSIYGVDLKFAKPSILSASLIIPEIVLAKVFEMVYTIPKFTNFNDKSGTPFNTVSEIKIIQSKNSISATAWNEAQGTRKLAITKAPNPNLPNSNVFLIHSSDFQQFTRSFYLYVMPDIPVGESYHFEVGITNLNNIQEIKAWVNLGEAIDEKDLYNQNTDLLAVVNPEEIQKINIKFYKYESSIRDLDLFLEVFPHSLSFTTGDGEHGMLPPAGAQIIIEVRETLGLDGNIPSSEFLISDVQVKEKWSGNTTKYYTTRLNGLSTAGSVGGTSVQDTEDIRRTILSKISIRNSVITENDYELLFQYQGTKPFVDAKFVDAHAFVFLFNVIRENDMVVKSTSMNYEEYKLFGDGGKPFYPEIDYAGYKLISPFYYKNRDHNTVDAYIVNPLVVISLRGDLTNSTVETTTEYKINMAITYDFNTNTSYLEITDGTIEGYEYFFVCNQFQTKLTENTTDHDVPYSYKISELITDPFCIIREPLEDIQVFVRDETGNLIASYLSDGSYHQLIRKQTMYKYFQETPVNEEILPSQDVVAYLDNKLNNSMTTFGELIGADASINNKVLLRMPFIDKEYFDGQDNTDFFQTMNSYFIVNYTEEFLNYNTLVSQAFHNTIDLPPKYTDYLFKRNTIENLNTPIIDIDVSVLIDTVIFMTSKFDTMTDLEIALKIKIITFLKSKEGFMVEFLETDLEKMLYDEFAPLIKNVNVASPTLFQVNSSAVIYRDIQNNLSFTDLLNFIPPYFYFDYTNLKLEILQ